MAIKAIIIRPFNGAPTLPEDMTLDYDRDPETEPIGGGFVAVVDGLFGYGVVIIKTGQEQIDILAADPDTLAISPLTEPEDGGKWPELDGEITPGALSRINAVLTGGGSPQLPDGISVRQALGFVAPGLDWAGFGIG